VLKSKSSKSSGCTHIHQKPKKFKYTLPACQKTNGNSFLGQDRSADSGIHVTRDQDNVRRVLRNSTKLNRTIQNKRHGMLTYGAVFLRDNELPHTAAPTRSLLEPFNWELFDHPPYSPDLAPSDYLLFTYLKN
jgi:hypothetical protein